jgi:hypothetical protein
MDCCVSCGPRRPIIGAALESSVLVCIQLRSLTGSRFGAGEFLDDSQRLAGVLNLEEVRLRAATVGRMQNQHQPAVKGIEDHAVAAVAGVERSILLPPTRADFLMNWRRERWFFMDVFGCHYFR